MVIYDRAHCQGQLVENRREEASMATGILAKPAPVVSRKAGQMIADHLCRAAG